MLTYLTYTNICSYAFTLYVIGKLIVVLKHSYARVCDMLDIWNENLMNKIENMESVMVFLLA